MKIGEDYIGVSCAFFCHDGKGNFLLHKRSKNSRDEQGTWDSGAGTLEFGETFEEAVRREIEEEYGVKPKNLKLIGFNNLLRKHNGRKTHWIAVIFLAEIERGKEKIGEPDKMDEINWFKKGKWPKPLHSMFIPHFEFVEAAVII